MKLSSRDESRRCRLVRASETVKAGLRLRCRREVDESRALINRLQGQSQVHGNGGGTAATFCVHYGEHFSARTFASGFAAHRGEADEGFQQIGGGGGALDKFPDSRAHGADDQLGLSHRADGEDGRFGDFLVKQFYRPERGCDAVGGDIDQNYVGRKGMSLTDDGVVGGQGHDLVAAHGMGHAGAIHENLQHGALVVVGGKHGY
jgi:hypothetical protein